MADANSTRSGRVCTKCGEFKSWDNFTKARKGLNGRDARCRDCARVYYLENRDKIIPRVRDRYRSMEDELREYARRRYRSRRHELLLQQKEYRQSDHGRRVKSEFLSRPERKLDNAVRVGVRRAFKGTRKSRPTWEMLGYSLCDLKSHLERQFLKGMSWDNYGEWHIDHIVPLADFISDYEPHEAVSRAWHLANLRPVWADENLRKNRKRVFLI